ncbi:MAG TPA: SUMF1/EgtB/PvdO family nonheme iron enzyme [Polyangiaceae bacterium]
MRSRWLIGSALGLLAGAVGSCRNSEPIPALRAMLEEEAHAASPAATEAMVALNRVPTRPAKQEPLACGEGMALVEGKYCPDVRLNCKKYLDPKGAYEYFRCAEYGPSTCLSKERRAMRFCIDKHEFTESGETLPANHRSWRDGDRTCRKLGKRMCMESEYNFACEGENMQPYPYGFTRDATACNADRDDVVSPAGVLRDLRAPSGSYERCNSPFGVSDLAGNLEEFVTIDRTTPARPAMKGSYWQPGRNFCRAAQTAHDMYYNGTETGFRCCSDAH